LWKIKKKLKKMSLFVLYLFASRSPKTSAREKSSSQGNCNKESMNYHLHSSAHGKTSTN
jgi:hypothetical protein